MKQIKKIFYTDVKNIFKNFFALVIIIGICFLPALYAWCNIYSNWDPYGNTGNLKVAAVSLDQGYTDEDGNYHNTGDSVIESLHENDKIDWQFVDSEEDAVDGVTSGKYYGAVVISDDFTYNMYNIFLEDVEKPSLVFYQNQKKNAVANKITDTVVGTIQSNINEEFIKVMTETVFAGANDLSTDIEEDGGVDGLIEKLETLNSDIESYQKMIDVAIQGNAILSSAATSAKDDVSTMQEKSNQSANDLESAKNSLESTEVTLDTYQAQVNATMTSMQSTIQSVVDQLNSASTKEDIAAMQSAVENCNDDIAAINKDLSDLASSVASSSDNENIESTVSSMQSLMTSVEGTLDSISTVNATVDAEQARANAATNLQSAITQMQSVQNQFNNTLTPQVNQCVDNLEQILTDAGNVMNSMSSTLAGMGNVFGALQVTASATDTSLEKTSEALELLSDRLTTTIDKVNAAADSDKVEVLMETLSGDPEIYGEFFSEPVEIETTAVYPVENYGSAVTPFYTTLAIWVGCLILTAIIKVRPNKASHPEANDVQMYFGRFLLFFALGQLQTLITVLGDICLLHVQCVHPLYFWLASAIASTVFNLLIYSLVVTFGDVGKAAAVVIVVIQIAGSSGTYPIELLPEFFQRVYKFFPFPYAINAMRECIAGMYEYNFVIYLVELCVFLVVGLCIGILLRIPFAELNHFMEKRMEDTEMM
ncbi:MAG: YhgE/Pip domain-containing protein [Lachnospiraceae bacterium]|nr:YhgE/Pip domain-containing protein [Lachnospiraceae bacterium]